MSFVSLIISNSLQQVIKNEVNLNTTVIKKDYMLDPIPEINELIQCRFTKSFFECVVILVLSALVICTLSIARKVPI